MKKIISFVVVFFITISIGSGLPRVYGEVMDSHTDTEMVSDDEIMDSIPEIDVLSGTYEPLLLAGWNFSIARLSDGTWWSWGSNTFGQLGHGDRENRLNPVRIKTELDTKIIIDAQVIDETIFVVTSEKKLYQWGHNVVINPHNYEPKVVATNVSDIGLTWIARSETAHHSLAVVKNGQVYVSGSGYYAQFGRGLKYFGAHELGNEGYARHIDVANSFPVLTSAVHETIPGTSFKRVSSGTPLTNVKKVTGISGGYGFVAVTNNNEIYSWGDALQTLATKNNHASIKSIGNIVDIRATHGRLEAYALNDKGELWTWTGAQGAATRIHTNVKSFDVMSGTIVVTMKNGDLYAKGDPTYGSVLGGNSTSFTKIQSGVVTSATGERHSLWMKSDGKVFGSGWNSFRQLSVSQDGAHETFTKVPNLSGVSSIYTAEKFSLASSKNSIYSWGETVGELGLSARSPRIVKNFESDVLSVSGIRSANGQLTSYALSNGSHYVLGSNWRDRMGYRGGDHYVFKRLLYNPKANAYIPNTVNGKQYVKPVDNSLDVNNIRIVDSKQGLYSGLALDEKGRVLAWGWSRAWGYAEKDNYQWGSEGVDDKATESYIKVPINEKVVQIAGDYWGFLALTEGGDVYSWGRSFEHVIGRPGNTQVPMKISELSNIVDISMGHDSGGAIDADGNIWTWGRNDEAQAGSGSIEDVLRPVNITQFIDVKFKKIDMGIDSSFAISNDGDLYAWGSNKYGQLGLGDRFSRTSPRKVDNISKVKDVRSGMTHSILLLDNGDVYAAGANSYGQLGLGEATDRIKVATEIPFPDYITIKNTDNQEYTQENSITLNGSITSVVDGHPLSVTYEVRGSSGILDSGSIGNFTSSRTERNFSKVIPLGSNYLPGGYTITVKVTNATTKFNNESAVNFALVDKEPPTKPKIEGATGLDSWSNKNVTVSVVPGVDKIDKAAKTFISYGGDYEEYSKPITITKEGQTVIQAYTIDASGNKSSNTLTYVQIDKERPGITITRSQSMTHVPLRIDVEAYDRLSGIDKIVYDNTGEIVKGFITVKENGRHNFTAYDKAGNTMSDYTDVNNIDTSLSIVVPRAISKEIILSESGAEVEIPPITVRDWRWEPKEWRMSVRAESLTNGRHTLVNGSMKLNGSYIDGMGASFLRNNKRGESSWPLGNMSLAFDLSEMTNSNYTSTIIWDVVSAP